MLEGDKTHLINVFSNLIDNAIKYCKGENPFIEITTTNLGTTISIKVKDNGIGIEKEEMMEAVHVGAAIKSGAVLVHGVQMMNRYIKLSM